MKDEAVHIRIYFRHEGALLKDGVNVSVGAIGSHFVCFRRGYKQIWIQIRKNGTYKVTEEEWDPKLKRFKPCVFSSDEST